MHLEHQWLLQLRNERNQPGCSFAFEGRTNVPGTARRATTGGTVIPIINIITIIRFINIMRSMSIDRGRYRYNMEIIIVITVDSILAACTTYNVGATNRVPG